MNASPWPNRVTAVRIALVAPLTICLLNLNQGWPGWRYLSLFIAAVMAVSDVLDGYLARRLRAESKLGRVLDPVADKLLVTSAVIILAVDETAVPGFRLPSWVAVLAVGKDVFLIIGFVVLHWVTGQFLLEPRRWGKACTLVQLVTVLAVLMGPNLPQNASWVVPVLWWAASALAVTAVVDYWIVGNRLTSRLVTPETREQIP